MRQRRFNLKPPRNEMPSPNDPRLKAYEAQRAIDKEALRLFAEGKSMPEAYRIAMDQTLASGGLVPSGALAMLHQDYVLPRDMVAKMEEGMDLRPLGKMVNITVKMPLADCDAQSAQRFPVQSRGKRQMPLLP